MHSDVEAICVALDQLAEAVLKATKEDRTVQEIQGWNCPAVSRHDLASMATSLAHRIRSSSPEEFDSDSAQVISDVPKHLELLRVNTVPQLFNGGNSIHGCSAYVSTLSTISATLDSLLVWHNLNDPDSMPPKLAKRIRTVAARLSDIEPNMDGVSEKIRLINAAAAAAESLPVDLQELSEARIKVNRISSEAGQVHADISKELTTSLEASEQIRAAKNEADKLVAQCEEAYRITTTKGLAAAFDVRAKSLAKSMWVWVAGLIAALVLGVWLGSDRIKMLSSGIEAANQSPATLWMHAIAAFLSVAGPVWFAWLATKQVGQRFRLAEDYAFKASVAKAYEGYRKEAARIDETFEARLFSSALSRLEEAPLRLVEGDSHGSPWHELISSSAFRSALEKVPDLRAQFLDIARRFSPKSGTNPPGAPEA